MPMGSNKKITHFLPFNSGSNPAKTAATPDAPPPSTTAFSISMHLRILIAIHSSDTVTILSIKGAVNKNLSNFTKKLRVRFYLL